ncbi:MAG: hypothetical protein ACOYXY_21915 [Thermodesulfobacteriota bacterium]
MTKPRIPLSQDIRMHRLVRLLREMPPERRDALLKTLKSNQLGKLLRKEEDKKDATKNHETS